MHTIFLDFDGARVNTSIYGLGGGLRDLSPLSDFLPRWGLAARDEHALIDAVIATVRENLEQDIAVKGTNPRVALRILNSRDHADPWGAAERQPGRRRRHLHRDGHLHHRHRAVHRRRQLRPGGDRAGAAGRDQLTGRAGVVDQLLPPAGKRPDRVHRPRGRQRHQPRGRAHVGQPAYRR
ncbi:hypothetical protein FHS29_003839 [Saccharothrix tamanrassetensis]|uniref:Uncharacterized protein n=1 Tax=Saccharothrix tamanrassetensis TaxID=1051531 RepID=A0A841CNZ9_9PSEU|nr:hypothetical protein [Saccharothrix tamanrassetensis]MBB5957246.1 hypothetical protein [Saccharothrix tamanrassetensis]